MARATPDGGEDEVWPALEILNRSLGEAAALVPMATERLEGENPWRSTTQPGLDGDQPRRGRMSTPARRNSRASVRVSTPKSAATALSDSPER